MEKKHLDHIRQIAKRQRTVIVGFYTILLPDLACCWLSFGGRWALDDAFTTAAVSVDI